MAAVMRWTPERVRQIARGALSPRELAYTSDADVRAILGDRSITQYAHIGHAAQETLAAPGDRRKRYVMVTESALPPFDRVLLIAGVDLREFETRGSNLFLEHMAGGSALERLPLGKVENIHTAKKRGVEALIGDGVFSGAELSDLAMTVWRFVDAGLLTGGSIGFDIDDEREPSMEEVKRYKISSPYATVVTAARLIEFSVVGLGRDPRAQVQQSLRAWCADGSCSTDTARAVMSSLEGAPSGRTITYALFGAGIGGDEMGATCSKCGGESDGNGLTYPAGSVPLTAAKDTVRALTPGEQLMFDGETLNLGGNEVLSVRWDADDAVVAVAQRLDALDETLAALTSRIDTLAALPAQVRALKTRVGADIAELRAQVGARGALTYTPDPQRAEPEEVEVQFDELPSEIQEAAVAQMLAAAMGEAN